MPSPERWAFAAVQRQTPPADGHNTRVLLGFISASAIVTNILKVIPKLFYSPKAIASADAVVATQSLLNLCDIIDKTVRAVVF